jgi:NADPH:quinone reductase-like Zn-dependent oxidoreductase
MKAVRYYSYGAPDVLQVADVDIPPIGDDEILVSVRAASISPLDWHFIRGLPYLVRPNTGLRKPKFTSVGGELAGVVEKVGRDVTKFKPGDEVFGGRGEKLDEHGGAFAEYAVVSPAAMLARKPVEWTFEQAAAIPVSGVSALQALRDKAKVHTGQTVLVNGAAGGMGTFTVQLAKAFGAEVTGVCGTGNVELVRSLGADEVIDYTKDDFTTSGKRYDVLIDNAASRSLGETKRVLAPKGVHVHIGLASTGNWFGPARRPLAMFVRNPFVSRRLVPFLGANSSDDLDVLRGLVDEGRLKPTIDRTYSLAETAEAIRYVETGHARAKVVITV